MSKIQTLIKEIDTLEAKEVEEVLQYLLKKTRCKESVKSRLARYRGKGQGVWQQDAQEYINQAREDDRF